MAMPLERSEHPFNYGDYLTWPAEERWEIIDGVPVAMGPAPMRRHQGISTNLMRLLTTAIPAGATCKVYHAPFDVRLPERNEADDDITTVVQPDLVIVCDPAKLDDRGCRGAPDLVIEILSPSSARHDMQTKRDLYERHAVREYWIVQPMERIVLVFVLHSAHFDGGAVYARGDVFSLRTLPGVSISVDDIFAE